MTPIPDIAYFLDLEGDRVPLVDGMTLGRHLENDLVLSGEDVLDYHLRLESTGRGPRAIPLGEASLRVNGSDRGGPLGLMPGDRLEIGQSLLELTLDVLHPPEADEWRLHAAGDADGLPIRDACTVGRSGDNDLQLEEDHISRFHAELAARGGAVWLRDLGSANGTFINGERLSGACRVYHGDEITFDTHRFQLIGRGVDLTPVRKDDAGSRLLPIRPPPPGGAGGSGDTTEFAAVEEPVAFDPPRPPGGESGVFLLGASDPVAGLAFRTPRGRVLIGRHDDCDLVLRDRSVSARHAELMVRAEGVTLTNLMATNGTRVNGVEVQSARLQDGDVLRLGRVSLVFKDVSAAAAGAGWMRHTQLALL
ncbi:MAG: FHA domain-containing protein, partial [Pseudomonadales bacterium]